MSSYGPRDLLITVLRYRRRVFLFFMVTMLSVLAASMSMNRVYTSSADILVRIGRESISMDPAVAESVNPVHNIGSPLQSEVASEIALLESVSVLEEALQAFGIERVLEHGKPFRVEFLNSIPSMLADLRGIASSLLSSGTGGTTVISEDLRTALEILRGNLSVAALDSSNVITVGYSGPTPGEAREMLAAIIASYQAKRVKMLRHDDPMLFFSSQATELAGRIRENERGLAELLSQAGTTSIAEQNLILANRVQELAGQIDSAEDSLEASEALVESLNARIAKLPERVVLEERSGLGNTPVEAMRERLFELRMREQELLGKFKESSYPVLSLRREIGELQALLDSQEPKRLERSIGLNEVRQDLLKEMLAESAKTDSLRASLAVLRRQRESLTLDIERFLGVENEIGRLERELEIQRANYSKYLSLAEQARINQALQTASLSNVSLIQVPSTPMMPSGMSRGLTLGLGLGFGLFGGIALAFVSDMLSTKVKTPEEARNLVGGSLAAVIPYTRGGKNALPSGGLTPSLQSHVLEQTRLQAVAQGLIHGEQEGASVTRPLPGLSILVTGGRRGDGVTSVTRILADLFSLSFGRVLVIDANMTNPSLHEAFSVRQTPGLANLVLGEVSAGQAIVRTSHPSMDFLPAGQLTDGDALRYYAKVTVPDLIATLIREIKKGYAFTILDGPALADGTPGAYLAMAADMAFLVMAEGESRRDVVRCAMDRLRAANPELPVHAVFNKRIMHIPAWLYDAL